MIEVALFTTPRISEIFGVQEKHLDFSVGHDPCWPVFLSCRPGCGPESSQAARGGPMGHLANELWKRCTANPEGFGRSVATRTPDLYRVKVEISITYEQPSMKTKDLAAIDLDAKLPPMASFRGSGLQTDSTDGPERSRSRAAVWHLTSFAHARGRSRLLKAVS